MSKFKKPALSLSQFMLRQQVLNQYRNFLRTIRLVENEEDRKEITKWVRDDFKRNKSIKDEELIRMQLTRSKIELKKLESTISFAFRRK